MKPTGEIKDGCCLHCGTFSTPEEWKRWMIFALDIGCLDGCKYCHYRKECSCQEGGK